MVISDYDIRITKHDCSLDFEGYKEFLRKELFYKRYSRFRDCKDIQFVENDEKHGAPKMNRIFYGFFKRYRKPPRYMEYRDLFFDAYVIRKANDKGELFYRFNDGMAEHCDYIVPIEPIEFKLYCGYMSFLKEVYFLIWMWENGFPEAFYSTVMDNCGYDVCVDLRHEKNGHFYGTRVHCKTDRSNCFYRDKTNYRIVPPEQCVEIDFEFAVLKKDNPYKIGDSCVSPIGPMQAVANIIKMRGTCNISLCSNEIVKESIEP